MNRDDIRRMASEAGFETKREMIWCKGWEISPFLARFAAIVAAAEREACADLCKYVYEEVLDDREGIAKLCEGYIRARSNT